MKHTLQITEKDGVVRIDKHLSRVFPEYSRAAITKLFTLNLIKYKTRPLKPGEKVRPGSVIEYDLGPLSEKPDVIELPIVYEDDDVLVVNKPTGIISHARGRFWQEASVASFIRDKLSRDIAPDTSVPSQNSHRAGIVHRLDRATSGVMITAKHTDSMKYLQKQFSDRTVNKTYLAVIPGQPEHEKATINAPVQRNPDDPKRFHVDPDGKSAVTDYHVRTVGDAHSLLELHPQTGRTHQLRLHLKHIGHTIVGDDLYDGEPATRLMLHAQSLEITTPDGQRRTFSAETPTEFAGYVT